jgi:hypothetical protein
VAGAVDDAVDEQGRRAQYLARSQAAVDMLADPVRHRDVGPVPVEHRHVEAELGGVPEQIAVSSAFRRWSSNSRMSQNRLCSAPPQLRQRQPRRAGGCWSTEMSERVVRRAV